jgi:hypothetical protein
MSVASGSHDFILQAITEEKKGGSPRLQIYTITTNEVMTIDNGCWSLMTIYYVKDLGGRSMMAMLEYLGHYEGCS